MAFMCSLCKLECNDDNALVCDQCSCNVHFACSELPTYLITFLELSDKATFCCKNCAQTESEYNETKAEVEKQIENTRKALSRDTPSANTSKLDLQVENNTINKRLEMIETEAEINRRESEPKRVCHFFRHNKCKHGKKGPNCPFRHPTPCKKHINGYSCKNTEKCPYWHPQVCKNGPECKRARCKRYHVLTGKFHQHDPKNPLGLASSRSQTTRPRPKIERGRNHQHQLIELLTKVISMIT